MKLAKVSLHMQKVCQTNFADARAACFLIWSQEPLAVRNGAAVMPVQTVCNLNLQTCKHETTGSPKKMKLQAGNLHVKIHIVRRIMHTC